MRIIIRIFVFAFGEERIARYLNERRDSPLSDIRRCAGRLCSLTGLVYVQSPDPVIEIVQNLNRVIARLTPEWESTDSGNVNPSPADAPTPPFDSASLKDIFHNAPDSCYYRAHDAKKKI